MIRRWILSLGFVLLAPGALGAQSRRVPVNYMSSEVQGDGVFEVPIVPLPR